MGVPVQMSRWDRGALLTVFPSDAAGEPACRGLAASWPACWCAAVTRRGRGGRAGHNAPSTSVCPVVLLSLSKGAADAARESSRPREAPGFPWSRFPPRSPVVPVRTIHRSCAIFCAGTPQVISRCRKSRPPRRRPARQGQIAAMRRLCFTTRTRVSRELPGIFQIGILCDTIIGVLYHGWFLRCKNRELWERRA